MAREIDQDIDAVATDLFGKFGIAQADGAVPVIRDRVKPFGDRVGRGDFGIAMEFDRRSVMRRKQWLCEQRNRMLTEVGRNVAHAQAPTRRPVEVEAGLSGQQRQGMLHRPSAGIRRRCPPAMRRAR